MNEMKKTLRICAVASGLFLIAAGSHAQTLDAIDERNLELDQLFGELQDPEVGNPHRIERQIYFIWSQSGSASADLLLERGQAAIEAGDFAAAVEHLTALTDHAPEFAEGWNARATAFFLQGEYGLALVDIKHTLILNPRHFGALSGLALILDETGDAENALKVYEQVNLLHPHLENVAEAIQRLTNATKGTAL